jgi:hypothetical protein
VHCLAKILIAYFSSQSKEKLSSEDKVANALETFFSKTHTVRKILLQSKKKIPLQDQFKLEKELELIEEGSIVNGFDLIVVGSPIVGSLTSAPLVNAFLRQIPKSSELVAPAKYALFSTGIIPGFAIKKMQSLLSMKGIKPIESETFTSIFDFDEKKMIEVTEFAQKLTQVLEN